MESPFQCLNSCDSLVSLFFRIMELTCWFLVQFLKQKLAAASSRALATRLLRPHNTTLYTSSSSSSGQSGLQRQSSLFWKLWIWYNILSKVNGNLTCIFLKRKHLHLMNFSRQRNFDSQNSMDDKTECWCISSSLPLQYHWYIYVVVSTPHMPVLKNNFRPFNCQDLSRM